VEKLTLTGSAAIDGTGNDIANVLTGNAANNRLFGLGGNDTLNGGAGSDTLAGGSGDDIYIVDNAGDTVFENPNEGIDLVNASVTYTLAAEVENLTLTGSLAISGTGNGLGNTLLGNAAANQLFGLEGDDTLNGGAGADTMLGGQGNDSYYVDNADDLVTEYFGEDTDTVNSTVSYVLTAYVENLVLIGTGSINGTGNGLDNSLTGNSGSNILDGGAGADTLAGDAGNDTYTVDDAGDFVDESFGAGTDTVNTSVSYTLADNVENLALTGTGTINGTGNALDNSLIGNSAANVLDGGAGADRLTGGGGYDVFVFRPGEAAGDVVLDFAGNGAAAGDSLKFMGFGAGAYLSHVAGQDFWSIFYDGGNLAETIELVGVTSLAANDYSFV
jgi:Ca2+-binding RTX toxin-like protein